MSLLQSVSQHFCGCPRRCPRSWPVLCGSVTSPTGLGRGSFWSWAQRAVSLLCPMQLQALRTADSQADSPSTPPPLHGHHCHLRFRPQGLPFPTGWRLGRVVPTVGNKISPQREMPPAKSHVISAPEQSCGMLVVTAFSGREQMWFCYSFKEESQGGSVETICLPMQETCVQSLGWGRSPEEEMTTHCSILA